MPTRVALLSLTAVVTCAVVAGCGSAHTMHLPIQTSPSPTVTAAGGPPAHVAIILMENEEYNGIVGASSTPYINGLAKRNALATEMYAITHPSLPNYLALTGGSTFGIDSDCTDCSAPGSGVAGQLNAKGISWKGYMEDLPHPCFTGSDSGAYAKKHDPFVYYRGIVRDPASCDRVVPLSALAADERSGQLPRFIWITPNLCHDMHDCDPAIGDRFLAALVPPLLRAIGPRGLLILTWDKGSSDNGCCRLAQGGHIATILAGGLAVPGARLRTFADHYSTLQTVEDLFGLPRLAGAACACTPSLQPLVRRR
jgi:phosphatidylinositol-3-phosphatase